MKNHYLQKAPEKRTDRTTDEILDKNSTVISHKDLLS